MILRFPLILLLHVAKERLTVRYDERMWKTLAFYIMSRYVLLYRRRENQEELVKPRVSSQTLENRFKRIKFANEQINKYKYLCDTIFYTKNSKLFSINCF